jgi:hypothetical protein
MPPKSGRLEIRRPDASSSRSTEDIIVARTVNRMKAPSATNITASVTIFQIVSWVRTDFHRNRDL